MFFDMVIFAPHCCLLHAPRSLFSVLEDNVDNQDDQTGYSGLFYVMLILGIIGVIGFLIVVSGAAAGGI
jgi:hypothetical protein